MGHVIVGTPWEPANWTKRFGKWEELTTTNWNPEIIKLYYFPSIDVTLTVNVLKAQIMTYSLKRGPS